MGMSGCWIKLLADLNKSKVSIDLLVIYRMLKLIVIEIFDKINYFLLIVN